MKIYRRFYRPPDEKKRITSSTVPFKVLFDKIKEQVLSDTVLNRLIRSDLN